MGYENKTLYFKCYKAHTHTQTQNAKTIINDVKL